MPATDASQPVRDLVDITDAEAQAAMKKSVEIDALADLELQAAEQINQQLQTRRRQGVRRFWRPKRPRGWCVPMRTRSRPWRNWCASARSSLPIKGRSLNSALLIHPRFTTMGARCFSRERTSRVLFSTAYEYGYRRHRCHEHHSHRNQHRVCDPVGWLPHRSLPGGIARRRPASARGHSDQVSGRCHDHRQLGVGLPGRERVV